MKNQFSNLISQVLTSKADTLDWGKVLILNDKLKADKKNEKSIFKSIKEIALKGTIKEKMNSIELVDSFFKNGTVETQKSLQINVPIIFPIDIFCNDRVIHMNFCKSVHSWAKICQKNHSLTNKFIQWMKVLYSFKFKYVMTPEIYKKFTDDFNTAHEFLLLVSKELIDAKKNLSTADFDELNELNEMNYNVIDVHQRLTALEKTSNDSKFSANILYLEYYCCVCIHAYESLKKNGTFEEEIMLEIEAQGMPSQKVKTNKTKYRQSLSKYQKAPTYIPPLKKTKSQNIKIPTSTNNNNNNDNNDTNPYQMTAEFYYPQSPVYQPQPNNQLEIERQQIQQLYTSHLNTSNQPLFMPSMPPQTTDNDEDDVLSWSQYPSVTPTTFTFDLNHDEDTNELPPPPFAPPPFEPPPYFPSSSYVPQQI